MRLSLPKKKETSVAASPPWMQEIEALNNLEFADLECALSRDHSIFYPMVFWATPATIAKLPTASALARGEYSGLGSEAPSERTFSYSGRAFSKLRRNMSVANLCAMVVGASYPFSLWDSEIMAEYETKREAIAATAAASRSAAAATAGTAGPVAAAAATAGPGAAAARGV